MEVLFGILAVSVGYFVGMATKGGININVTSTRKDPAPVPQEEIVYNKSTAEHLPPDVKQYFEENQGFMR